MAAQLVAVTGASGYIAGHCIKELLRRGYGVRATVRSLANETKVKHLHAEFPGVQLFEADLLAEGSFDACFAGCKFVLHTASPFQLSVEDPQRDLVDPAVKGTLNVLNSAKRAGTVGRVVVTSSCAAVSTNAPRPGHAWNEEDWNNDSSLTVAPYRYSKSLAEQAAWDFVKDDSCPFDVVTINPSLVVGPPLSVRTDSTSVRLLIGLLDGKHREGAPGSAVGYVDVNDIAVAHVNAMEKPEAKGRHVCTSSTSLTWLDIADELRKDPELEPFYPALPTALKSELTYRAEWDHSKAERELGIAFTPVGESVRAMAKFLISAGLVTPPAAAPADAPAAAL